MISSLIQALSLYKSAQYEWVRKETIKICHLFKAEPKIMVLCLLCTKQRKKFFKKMRGWMIEQKNEKKAF